MKQSISLLLVFLLFVGCVQGGIPSASSNIPKEHQNNDTEVLDEPASESVNKPLQVVTTIFPQFDFVRQIAGDRVELTMLISPGVESHSFEPTPRDMIALSSADLLIYVGGHSEAWVYPILSSLELENL